MPNVDHQNLTGAPAVHPAAFIQATDPGAVGAGKFWVDKSTAAPYQLKLRNTGNTAWENVGTLSSLPDPTTTRGDLLVRGPSTLGRLGVGSINSLFTSDGVDPFWSTTPSVSGELTALDFKANGVTGANNTVRIVGGVASGVPVSGTFAVRDMIIDSDGTLWICTAAGSPGTWVQANSTFASALSATALRASGLTGAANAVRIVGGNATGSPTTGTFQVRDVVIDSDGTAYVCTTAGTPGTWARLGGSANSLAAGFTSSDVIKRTHARGTGNKTTTSTTFTAISSADLPPVTLQLNIGDIVRCRLNAAHAHSSTASTFYDFEVINGAGTTRVGGSAASGVGVNASTVIQPVSVEATYEATVGGAHTFQPVWRTESGTATLYNDSGTTAQDVVIGFTAEKIGTPPTLSVPSNLIFDRTLTAATTTVDTGPLSQAYRDLRIEITGRTDAAAVTERLINIRFNNDATAIYDRQYVLGSGGTATSAELVNTANVEMGWMPGASSAAGVVSSFTIHIPNYSGAQFKTAVSLNAHHLSTGSGQHRMGVWSISYRSTNAISSIQFTPLTSGSFVAGTNFRIYGEPVAAGLAAIGTGARTRISADQSIADDTDAVVNWDTEDSDPDSQHYTSSAALSGTVSKTSASATLTGSGTAFTTELSVGQVISVPGTAAEKRVVTVIASNTSLTVNTPFANTASGQTATRVNSAIVFRQTGFYNVDAGLYWAADADGYRRAEIVLNDTTVIGGDANNSIGAIAMPMTVSVSQNFTQWDFVEVRVRHTAGASLNLTADQRTFFSANARPTLVVTLPYVKVVDQRGSGTEGGTFTSGAWQTRTLNTVVTDTAGVVSLSTNQITLPVGRYRIVASAPGFAVDRHVLRLQNMTASTTLLTSPVAYSGSGGGSQTDAIIRDRFTLSVASALELQHRCATTTSTNGLGLAAGTSFTVDYETFAQAEIWKEG